MHSVPHQVGDDVGTATLSGCIRSLEINLSAVTFRAHSMQALLLVLCPIGYIWVKVFGSTI